MYQMILAVIISLYGLLIGSFLNVLIYRLPRKENFVLARSYCPKCNHQLAAGDLIPLFSYIFSGGKCRYCRQPISPRYPLIELLNSVIYLLIYLRAGLTANAIFDMVLSSMIIVIAFIDYDTKKITNASNLVIVLLSIVKILIVRTPISQIFATILFAVIFCCLSGALSLLFKRMLIGMGDIKYLLASSLYFSLNQFTFIVFSSFIVAGCFVISALLSGKLKLKDNIALGPFLALSSILALLIYSDNSLLILAWS